VFVLVSLASLSPGSLLHEESHKHDGYNEQTTPGCVKLPKLGSAYLEFQVWNPERCSIAG
jgi:hypothetical protein